MRTENRTRSKGLTLLELILTIVIVLVLAGMVAPISSRFKKRTEKVKCISQMRTLHSSFVAYVAEKGKWPQLPTEEKEWNEDKFYRFWVTSLEPYGSSADTWLCPSDKLMLQMKKSDLEKKRYFGTYVPTPFDSGPGTPFRWNQPWLIERGDFHGNGGHMLMPDGSVHDTRNPFSGR